MHVCMLEHIHVCVHAYVHVYTHLGRQRLDFGFRGFLEGLTRRRLKLVGECQQLGQLEVEVQA